MVVPPASSEAQMVQSLGFAIYRALDWGLDESEERELSPQLEKLIDLMANSDCEDSSCGAADEGYGGPEEEEENEGGPRAVRTFAQAMRLCALRLTDPHGAQAHYQAVCRALFVETLELRAFLARVREAKEMLQKLGEDEPQVEKPLAELDHLGHTDWARLWVQLMRELRHGVKLKKVQEQEFNPLPTEFQLTPFEMLMQDIRARNYKLRKVMVDGDIPPRVKKDAHELILDFIRSRPPLKQVSERRLRPVPQKQRTLHEKILEEIKQERRLRPVGVQHLGARGFGSLPCILNACSGDIKSTSCINLSVTDAGSGSQRPRPRVLLKAPTLAEMEEMNTSEEFSHPVESLALTVEEVMDVRRVLVKAEMEKFLQDKELFSSLKRGKMKMPSKKCAHIPVYTLGFESLQRVPTTKATPMLRRDAFQSLQGPKWRSVEEEFPHIYAHGCVLKDVCSDCTSFVADVVCSSRKSVDVLNATPQRSRQTQSLYIPNTRTLNFQLSGPMSRRALRRLRGEQRGQEPLGPDALQFVLLDDDDAEEEGPKQGSGGRRPGGAGKEGVRVNNRFELINIEDLEDDLVVNGERSDCTLPDAVSSGNKGRAQRGKPETKQDEDVAKAGSPEQENGLEDIDRILERIEDSSGFSHPGPPPLNSRKQVLYVEHRPRQRQRVYPKCTWLTTPKSTWPRYSKPGLSMRLLESKKGLSFFAFEHSEEYQQAQHKFLVAVESMEPNNIVVLLQTSPYHVDSLLQLSDACRFQEDQEMARDLIERALYSMECAFHPLFSLTSGTCRLDYRRPENRSFYLALYKQMSFLEKRGCPRTALEYCKLILSLEPDEDPLCMLLLIDHLALRARNYEYLIRLFQEWEAHRNLSQLPNFAFSVPLAYFLLSQQTDLPEHELTSARQQASLLIQQALTMFPGALMPLLEYCSVRPDATVSNHRFFGPDAEISQPPALSQLVSLYLGRSHFLWKEPATMSWLEENVREVLQAVDAGDSAVEACENRRKVLYQRAPRNIHRHVILSEIKEAVAALPSDVTTQSVMGFDPLPPLDTIYSYVRPERLSPVSHGNTIALFFRSLLPNYTTEGERLEEGVARGPNRNQGLNRLMLAVRDMMANFHFNDQEVPREDNPEGEGDWD
ncbi:Transcription factor 25 [Cricetulus griseus]|uniref:Transcription factor 25 n=3 Tax=cellular organisms TaxID=131567 RepID=G3GRQ2_CRIGR|nr:Transcription factor 25 [Cricetulus griseus]